MWICFTICAGFLPGHFPGMGGKPGSRKDSPREIAGRGDIGDGEVWSLVLLQGLIICVHSNPGEFDFGQECLYGKGPYYNEIFF